MDETVTRLHSSIDAALEYLTACPGRAASCGEPGGALRCSAVRPQRAVSHGELLERINSSGVLVHSVGFGTDAEAESLAALTEASGGIHQVVGDSLTAADAAAALAEDAGALYVTGFSWPASPGGGDRPGLRHLCLRR